MWLYTRSRGIEYFKGERESKHVRTYGWLWRLFLHLCVDPSEKLNQKRNPADARLMLIEPLRVRCALKSKHSPIYSGSSPIHLLLAS